MCSKRALRNASHSTHRVTLTIGPLSHHWPTVSPSAPTEGLALEGYPVVAGYDVVVAGYDVVVAGMTIHDLAVLFSAKSSKNFGI